MVANIFGQIYAIKQRLNIQNRISAIGRELSRVTRNITRSEKQLNSQKRAEINYVKQKNNQEFSMQAGAAMLAKEDDYSSIFKDGKLNNEACKNNMATWDLYQQALSQWRAWGQSQLQAQLDEIENRYEYQYEIQIQTLKDEQEDLETEKAGLTTQLEAAKGMEQTEKQFAQENLKSLFDNRA